MHVTMRFLEKSAGGDVLVAGVDGAAVAALMCDPSMSCMRATMSAPISWFNFFSLLEVKRIAP